MHCPRRACGSPETVATRSYSVSVTGCRTQLFVCRRCLYGFSARWAPNRPSVWVVLDLHKPTHQLTCRYLREMGYARREIAAAAECPDPAA